MIHIGLPIPEPRRVVARVVEPHKRLMAAVLQTVLDDYWGSAHRRSAGLAAPPDFGALCEATAYVASTDRGWPFSFENLCEALGVNADCLRRQLQKEPHA